MKEYVAGKEYHEDGGWPAYGIDIREGDRITHFRAIVVNTNSIEDRDFIINVLNEREKAKQG